MYIFISHSSAEAETARQACGFLEANGHKCFLAPRDIRSGYEYAEEIVEGIDRADAVILLLSEHANRSPHVLREIERAVSRSVPIIVYKLEEVQLTKSMEYFLMTHQWMNAGTGGDFTELLEGVANLPKPAGEKKSGKRPKILAAAAVGAALVIAVIAAVFALPAKSDNAGANGKAGDSDIADGGASDNAGTDDGAADNGEKVSVKLGDTVTFGSYNGERIEWRVLKISDDGKEAVLVAKNILTMKAYDAPDSGKYNYDKDTDYWSQGSAADTDMELQARVRGSSDWSVSTIRTWLNSEAEVVKYEGQAPLSTAMSDMKNGYNDEPGFLHGFTDAELKALKTSVIKTKRFESGSSIVTTEDRVYLLSADELSWFDEAGVSLLAEPTEAALEQDETGWYQVYSVDYGMKAYYWWLREPVEGYSSKCYMVGNGYTEENMTEYNAGVEGFGIRPAVTVDLSSLPREQ